MKPVVSNDPDEGVSDQFGGKDLCPADLPIAEFSAHTPSRVIVTHDGESRIEVNEDFQACVHSTFDNPSFSA
ncbi:hypothetical protein ALP01_200524 [Pseudomonas caricapapayae]|nr:hypothetical protein ALP01_200524 [Pseudomonas caricapapayae]